MTVWKREGIQAWVVVTGIVVGGYVMLLAILSGLMWVACR